MLAVNTPYLKYIIAVVFGLLLCGFFFFALSAGSGTQESIVMGKVELDGLALKGGTITFVCKDGNHSTAVSERGTYRLEKLPAGPAKIQVKSHAHSPLGNFNSPNPKEDPKKAEAVLEIPEKYNDAQKSGLTCDVKPGLCTHDIQLRKQ